VSNRPFYTKVLAATDERPVQLTFRHLKPGHYRLTARRTGYHANDAYSAYLEMGSPKSLGAAQLRSLQALTRDAPVIDRVARVGPRGTLSLELPMRSNDIVLVTLKPARAK
jgi:xylan 1,4-beta-xylosidase